MPAFTQPSALSTGWAAVTRRETSTSAEQVFAGLQMAHLKSKGCEDLTEARPAWWEPAQLPSVSVTPACGSCASLQRRIPAGARFAAPAKAIPKMIPLKQLSQICMKSCCMTSSTVRLLLSSESFRSSMFGGGVRAAGEGSEEADV